MRSCLSFGWERPIFIYSVIFSFSLFEEFRLAEWYCTYTTGNGLDGWVDGRSVGVGGREEDVGRRGVDVVALPLGV